MLKFYLFTFCVFFTTFLLSGHHGSEQKIPVPPDAHGLIHHSMPNITAQQIDFYLLTKKNNMKIFKFYSEKFNKHGWITCGHGANWINYRKAIKNHGYIDIHQNSMYMVSPEKKQLLAVVAQYFISNSVDIGREESKGQLKQRVKVVRYQLDDRGYAMALNKYECVAKSATGH